jgi:hypothetical protein
LASCWCITARRLGAWTEYGVGYAAELNAATHTHTAAARRTNRRADLRDGPDVPGRRGATGPTHRRWTW